MLAAGAGRARYLGLAMVYGMIQRRSAGLEVGTPARAPPCASRPPQLHRAARGAAAAWPAAARLHWSMTTMLLSSLQDDIEAFRWRLQHGLAAGIKSLSATTPVFCWAR